MLYVNIEIRVTSRIAMYVLRFIPIITAFWHRILKLIVWAYLIAPVFFAHSR